MTQGVASLWPGLTIAGEVVRDRRVTAAIHEVASQLIVHEIEQGRRGVAICGASRSVGVTFTSINLAIAIAQTGIDTLLIDANLSNPAVCRAFNAPDKTRGLQQILRSESLALSELVEDSHVPNLSILHAGGAATDASELLASASFERTVRGCLRDFAYTIIDTPAANRTSDCRRIVNVVGYALLVARRNITFVDDVSILESEIIEDGGSVIGTILNGA